VGFRRHGSFKVVARIKIIMWLHYGKPVYANAYMYPNALDTAAAVMGENTVKEAVIVYTEKKPASVR
jgi:hypothetical protein